MELIPVDDGVRTIGGLAARIRRDAESIAQAHSFGLGPGLVDDPFSLETQRNAMELYTSTLPWDYLVSLANKISIVADSMVAMVGPVEHAEAWSDMQRYLRSIAQAIREEAPDVCPSELPIPDHLASVTPPVMPFDRLGAFYSEVAVRRMRSVASELEQWSGAINDSPLTEQEAEWMRQIVAGQRSIDIARASGYSERSLYRALSDLWERIGVDGRVEAISMVVERGWIEPSNLD